MKDTPAPLRLSTGEAIWRSLSFPDDWSWSRGICLGVLETGGRSVSIAIREKAVSHVSHVSHAESVFKEKLQGMSCLVTNTRTLAGLEALVQTYSTLDSIAARLATPQIWIFHSDAGTTPNLCARQSVRSLLGFHFRLVAAALSQIGRELMQTHDTTIRHHHLLGPITREQLCLIGLATSRRETLDARLSRMRRGYLSVPLVMSLHTANCLQDQGTLISYGTVSWAVLARLRVKLQAHFVADDADAATVAAWSGR
ncbi:hypothetical protein BJ166DRAFT_602696 [Pestalotiopsis sp. NC0098]|nr:hypothetical protein BJ166DRAFT_602696 [Pestalotiopsis sp. NC0098]